jgi:peptidoglycan-associated lipoprotein
MRHTRFPLAFTVIAAAFLASCTSTPLETSTPATSQSTVGQEVPGASPTAPSTSTTGVGRANAQSGALPAHQDPANPLSRERSVYFDYDDDSIKSQWLVVIERHGRYLASNPALPVTVQGHTDERGGREYNLALGQRRAEAVRRVLLIYGVKPTQVEAVSLGEERPKADGHDESAWQQNRRADIAYPAAK